MTLGYSTRRSPGKKSGLKHIILLHFTDRTTLDIFFHLAPVITTVSYSYLRVDKEYRARASQLSLAKACWLNFPVGLVPIGILTCSALLTATSGLIWACTSRANF